MNENVFKNLVIFVGFVFIVLVGKTIMNITYMPEELYLYSLDYPFNEFLALIALLMLLVHFISIILLYFFVKFGKILFVVTYAISLGFILLSDFHVFDNVDYFLDALHGVASGAIILMLYNSPIKERF